MGGRVVDAILYLSAVQRVENFKQTINNSQMRNERFMLLYGPRRAIAFAAAFRSQQGGWHRLGMVFRNDLGRDQPERVSPDLTPRNADFRGLFVNNSLRFVHKRPT
jgi:hypothetical protein